MNKIVHGDVLDTISGMRDCVDMVWSDPDYNVGIDYNGRRYTKPWSEYVDWLVEVTWEGLLALKETGNLFVVNYPRANAWLRVHMEEHAHDIFEYVWCYPTNVGHSKRRFTTAHRTILHMTRSDKNAWYKEQVAQPYKNTRDRRIVDRLDNGSSGRMPYSWQEVNLVKNVSREKRAHPCQIPIDLYSLYLNASTVPGDTVFVMFGGSGQELVYTRDSGRRFISCEIHDQYYANIVDQLDGVLI